MIINDQRLFEGFNQGHFWPLKHAKGQKKAEDTATKFFFFADLLFEEMFVQ